MRDRAARRVAGDEHAPEVGGGLREPAVGGGHGLVPEPAHEAGAVVEGGGEAVLGGQAVPRGEHDGAGVRGEAEAELVNVRPRARPQAEATTVEVDEHGKLLPGGGGRGGRRLVHAHAEVLGLVVDGLLPLHRRVAAGEGGRAEHRACRRPEHGAVAEHAQEAEEVLGDLGSRRRGGAAGGGRDGRHGLPTSLETTLEDNRSRRLAELMIPSCLNRLI